MLEPGQDAVMSDDRLRKGQPRREIGQRAEAGRAALPPAERLIEAIKDRLGGVLGMEPPFEARPRQIVKLADALQARAAATGE